MNELALFAGAEAASWEESSLDGAPDALLSLMPIAEVCCLPVQRDGMFDPFPIWDDGCS